MMPAPAEVFAKALATESCRRAPPTTIARDERVDAEIKNRAARECQELLGAIRTQADASSTRGNDGGYVH